MSTISIKEEITFDDFLAIESKLSIRIGTITSVERVPKSDKLLKLTVSFGDSDKTVVTNIGNRIVQPEVALKFQQFPFIMNLKPSKMMGIISEAMIMVPENKDGEIELAVGGRFTNGLKLM